MHFSVIYSFDIPHDTSVKEYLPPKTQLRKLWQQTEGDEQYELSHLGDEWEKGKHRKLCAILTRKQFDDFVRHCDLRAESTETMGSLGAPGFGMGWAPAISFNLEAYGAYGNAYVTPIPDFDPVNRGDDEDYQRRCWDRIKKAVLSVYG